MKVTKKMQRLIRMRKEYAEKLLHCENVILQYLEKNNIEHTELINNYGCLIITEPNVYAEKTLKLIESA